ncbi:uncharacterized protein GGS25DRAFT_506456 [Hypoxylon fragiforme]|uniref:uncharacterized protein n=1 Tax=Hypoxylon fragiforme TaxID=63214 RepID=UPI0020C60E1D|nr:uncharacterized protein GGS25DRAFT_506456 [Hypoxylon fragiforme]KAI2603985.1 hypothetical protein GGS25DRAFT_506456 [Hypoxylon fragiforme]
MSIDLNWETLTGGPDGAALAEHIRDFIHVKFQSVPLPRFIKSVTVHNFEFGTIPPSVVLKDICDPLPDFYEENPDVDDGDDDDEEDEEEEEHEQDRGVQGYGHADDVSDAIRAAERRRRADQIRRLEGRGGNGRRGRSGSGNGSGDPGYVPEGLNPPHIHIAGLRSAPGTPDLGNPFLGLGVSTPGVPGGTANMHYFQSKLATGWSGTQTPLAAVAGAQHLNGWLDMGVSHSPLPGRYQEPPTRSRSRDREHSRQPSQSSTSVTDPPPTPAVASASLAPAQHPLREKHSVSTLAPTSAGASRPPTRDMSGPLPSPLTGFRGFSDRFGHAGGPTSNSRGANEEEYVQIDDDEEEEEPKKFREPKVDDLQAVFRIKYTGDVKLMLTAEILLDYPMPSFVGIPVKLNITGLTFDGVGVVAYIRKRVHFCFLSPEDALAAVGRDDEGDDKNEDEHEDEDGMGDNRPSTATSTNPGLQQHHRGRLGSLLQEVRVESEIGQREGSKQSLKNVGKVEKFVLEQVRRIFEEEFVYPSFWTFLV